MTAAEARALTNAANEKEFDHEAEMTQIMAAIEAAANKGESGVYGPVSSVNSQSLSDLGFKISFSADKTNATIKW